MSAIGALVVACKNGRPIKRRAVVCLADGSPDSEAKEMQLFVDWFCAVMHLSMRSVKCLTTNPRWADAVRDTAPSGGTTMLVKRRRITLQEPAHGLWGRLKRQFFKKVVVLEFPYVDDKDLATGQAIFSEPYVGWKVIESVAVPGAGQDIGQIGMLTKLAGEVGLDEKEFEEALGTRKYGEAHRRSLRHAYEGAGVTGVPMYAICSKSTIDRLRR